ncbi:MAG: nicotinate (nicotinamide) nucleotide adenylyltransferase [Chloroflexota bacterium]
MAQRIGILGGAFDPPHVGHLILGETARQQLSLQRVLFMPTGHPPHKEDRSVTPIRHRMAMTELAVVDNAAFFASAIDAERPAPHFTSTLRPCIEAAYPGDELVLLIGGDSLRDLPDWHDPHIIVDQWQIAALPRPEYDIDWEQLEKAVPGIRQVATILDGPSVALSSTQIRRWVNAGRSLRYLLPSSVSRYIYENGLYLSRPGAGGTAERRR